MNTILAREVPDYYTQGGFEVLKIADIQLSIDKLVSTYYDIRDNYKFIDKDGYSKYHSICLQYRQGSSDPLYGDVRQLANTIVDGIPQTGAISTGLCSEFNEIGHKFGFLFEILLKHFVVLRGRIMLADPKFVMHWHQDGPVRRLHVPLITDPGCQMEYRSGNLYHMPADGSCYLVDAEPEHRALNHSNIVRAHITFEIFPI